MEQITITKTKNYLILKIPTKGLERNHGHFVSEEERVIQEGLKALEEGRVSKPLKGTKRAIAFLRNL